MPTLDDYLKPMIQGLTSQDKPQKEIQDKVLDLQGYLGARDSDHCRLVPRDRTLTLSITTAPSLTLLMAGQFCPVIVTCTSLRALKVLCYM